MCPYSDNGHFYRDTFISNEQMQLNTATALLWNITEWFKLEGNSSVQLVSPSEAA